MEYSAWFSVRKLAENPGWVFVHGMAAAQAGEDVVDDTAANTVSEETLRSQDSQDLGGPATLVDDGTGLASSSLVNSVSMAAGKVLVPDTQAGAIAGSSSDVVRRDAPRESARSPTGSAEVVPETQVESPGGEGEQTPKGRRREPFVVQHASKALPTVEEGRTLRSKTVSHHREVDGETEEEIEEELRKNQDFWLEDGEDSDVWAVGRLDPTWGEEVYRNWRVSLKVYLMKLDSLLISLFNFYRFRFRQSYLRGSSRLADTRCVLAAIRCTWSTSTTRGGFSWTARCRNSHLAPSSCQGPAFLFRGSP